MQHEINRQLADIGDTVYLFLKKGIDTGGFPSNLNRDDSIEKFYLLKRALLMDTDDEMTRNAISILLNE